MDEKQRKRLIKNEKRRIWRRKKKEEFEAMRNRLEMMGTSHTGISSSDRHELIDTILTSNGNVMNLQSRNGKSYLGVINRMSKLPLNNSKILY
jgi:hypothetical protein